ELLPDLPAQIRRLLRDLAPLGEVTAGLCEAIGWRRARDDVALLARIGLLSPPVPGQPSYRLVPVIAAVVKQTPSRSTAYRSTTEGRSTGQPPDRRLPAADWYARHGPLSDAVLAYGQAGADAQVTALLL